MSISITSECLNLFSEIQAHISEQKGSVSKEYLLNSSRCYRAIIEATTDGLDAQWRQLLFVWHLFEIFFFDKSHSAIISPVLTEWCRNYVLAFIPMGRASPNGSSSEGQNDSSDRGDGEQDIWEKFLILFLLGEKEAMTKLLETYISLYTTEEESSIWSDFIGLSSTIPVISSNFSSSTDFLIQFKQWQRNAEGLLRRPIVPARLQCLLQICLGDVNVYNQTIEEMTTTMHFLVILAGRMRFFNPMARVADIANIVPQPGLEPETNPIEECCLYVFDLDIYNALLTACKSLNLLFVCHLGDLLNHAGYIDLDVRNRFLGDYTQSFLNEGHQNHLWKVGLEYVRLSNQGVQQYLLGVSDMILNSPLLNEKEVFRVLDSCNEYPDIGKSLCTKYGQMRQEKYPIAGLWWLLRGSDPNKPRALANELLEKYLQTGQLRDMDRLVESLHNDFCLNDRLAFAGECRRFHQLLEQGQLQEASRLFSELFRPPTQTPRSLWVQLLSDAAPLFEYSPPFFSRHDILLFLKCLQDVLGSHRKDEFLNRISQEQLLTVRLSLARCLARTIVMETQIK